MSIQKHTFQWINPSADRTIWNLTSSGEYFSSKSAHSLLDSSDSPTINWRWIWRLPCTYRIQHFVWLVVQERLSTRNNLSIRHISNTPYCEWCPSTPETACHALRDCIRASAIWSALSFPLSRSGDNPYEWIHCNSKNKQWSYRYSLANHFPFCHLAHLEWQEPTSLRTELQLESTYPNDHCFHHKKYSSGVVSFGACIAQWPTERGYSWLDSS